VARFVGARVVTDAAASGELEISSGSRRARLRLQGPGVPSARLVLRTRRGTTRITGTVGRRHVNVRVTR
jgi:hypothetical protein